jgi:hypothetical protein
MYSFWPKTGLGYISCDSSGHLALLQRVARWFKYKPNPPNLVYFWRPWS